jgi:beta-mannosidase
MRNLLSILALLIFFGCKLSEEKPIIQKLHTNWEFKSDHDSVWKSASVPGNIFSDLLEHKIIENPFILNNEEKVQWVSDSSWVYKTIFQLNKEILSKKHIELNFEGLDTRAKIYINGNYQLDTDNAFRNYTISLKDITIAKKNELKIEFQPANLINDGVTPFENRVYTRKAQFQYGWDWGPKSNSNGI